MPRSKGTELSPQLHSRILELRDIGWSYQKIATKHYYLKAQSNIQFNELKPPLLPPPPPSPPPPLFLDLLYDVIAH